MDHKSLRIQTTAFRTKGNWNRGPYVSSCILTSNSGSYISLEAAKNLLETTQAIFLFHIGTTFQARNTSCEEVKEQPRSGSAIKVIK